MDRTNLLGRQALRVSSAARRARAGALRGRAQILPWPSETNGPAKRLSLQIEAKFAFDALGFGIELRKTGSKIHVVALGGK